MNESSNIERVVMRRVHAIRVVRPLLSGTAIACVLFAAALWGIGREVWVARVLENMPQSGDLVAVSRFYLAAFDHTRALVQALSLLTIASLIYLARKTAQLVTSSLVLARG